MAQRELAIIYLSNESMIMEDDAAAVVQATAETMHMHGHNQDGDARRENNNWCEYYLFNIGLLYGIRNVTFRHSIERSYIKSSPQSKSLTLTDFLTYAPHVIPF